MHIHIGTGGVGTCFQTDTVIAGIHPALPDLHIVTGVDVNTVIIFTTVGTDCQIVDLDVTAFDIMLHPEN